MSYVLIIEPTDNGYMLSRRRGEDFSTNQNQVPAKLRLHVQNP